MYYTTSNINDGYNYLKEEKEYRIMKDNWRIDIAIPYKNDIDPRLVRFLRDLMYHKIYKLKSCVPLYMKYHVKKEDWDEITNYVKKYKLTIFYKHNMNKDIYAGY